MGNPMLRNMMEGMQNGGGMPDMSQVSHISLSSQNQVCGVALTPLPWVLIS